MVVSFNRFAVSLVLQVPNPQRFVVSYAQKKLATGVEREATDPVIMANLQVTQSCHPRPVNIDRSIHSDGCQQTIRKKIFKIHHKRFVLGKD